MIKVSVIIPVFNVEKYLNQCLDSVCAQTLKDIEIICINDGSTDNSYNLLCEYAKLDSRIIIINQSNKGVSSARNAGVKLARGEFLCFIDSDDYVDSDYLEKLYQSAVTNNCEIACSGFIKVSGIRKSVKKEISKVAVLKNISEKIEIEQIPKHNYIWNKIFLRQSFINNNFKFAEGRFFEDIEIVIKILNTMGDMVTVPDVYYYYRKNPDSIVHRQNIKKKQDYYWAISEFQKYINENNIEIENNSFLGKRYIIKFWGFTILKIYQKEFKICIKLFGFVPIITISY